MTEEQCVRFTIAAIYLQWKCTILTVWIQRNNSDSQAAGRIMSHVRSPVFTPVGSRFTKSFQICIKFNFFQTLSRLWTRPHLVTNAHCRSCRRKSRAHPSHFVTVQNFGNILSAIPGRCLFFFFSPWYFSNKVTRIHMLLELLCCNLGLFSARVQV